MKRYIFTRLIAVLPTILGISFFSFVLINLRASDPAEIALRVNHVNSPTEEMIQDMRMELGLDKPFLVRYVSWLGDIVRGDFGSSYVTRNSVTAEIAQALPATLYLAAVALIIIMFVSIAMGVLCSVYEGGIVDKVMRAMVFLGNAMPSFWVGLLLIWLFSVKLNWFDTGGMEQPSSVLLPAVTLSLVYVSTYVRLIRNNMIKNKNENFALYAQVRGLKNSTVTRKVLKNSLHTSITALGMSIPKLIAGTVVVENIFAWPGIGRLSVGAIFSSDLPVIQAYILIMGILFVICNLLVDILNTVLDPRMRREV